MARQSKNKDVIKHRNENTAHVLITDFSTGNAVDEETWDAFTWLTPEDRAWLIRAAINNQQIFERMCKKTGIPQVYRKDD